MRAFMWRCGFAIVALGCAGCDIDDDDDGQGNGNPRPQIDAGGEGEGEQDAGEPDEDGGSEEVSELCSTGIQIPEDQHFVAPGLCATVVAYEHAGLRQITFASNGDLFGVQTSGAILRFRDFDGDKQFDPGAPETVRWGSVGGNGNNAHIDENGGYLYAGSAYGVVRFPYSTDRTGGEPQPVVNEQPGDGSHTFHTVHVYDGFLYVQMGSAGNAVAPALPEYDRVRSVVKRFRLASFDPEEPWLWSEGEVVSVGLRNTVGFTQHPSGKIIGVVNGMDDLQWSGLDVSMDNPGEQVVVIEPGRRYGYPYCFTAQRISMNGIVVPPGTQLHAEGTTEDGFFFTNPHDDAWCAQNSDPPLTFLQAHSAPLDITFMTQPTAALPEELVGGAFIALHGSWNRDPPTGYKVIWLPFDEDGNAPMPSSTVDETDFPYDVIFGGGSGDDHVDGNWGWSDGTLAESPRPVGVAISPLDGALYVSSDRVGMIYRIALKQPEPRTQRD